MMEILLGRAEFESEVTKKPSEFENTLLEMLNETTELNNNIKTSERSRGPRYIDTRMNDVYPVKKSRISVVSSKGCSKVQTSFKNESEMNRIPFCSKVPFRELPSTDDHINSTGDFRGGMRVAPCATENCNESVFRTVTDISSGTKKPLETVLDMGKALKGLVAHGPTAKLSVVSDSCKKYHSHGNFVSEFSIHGQKIPLDLTLKTRIHFMSSCSVAWIHKSVVCNAFPYSDRYNIGEAFTDQTLISNSFHSWIFPQSSLSSSVISAMSSIGDKDSLRKRHMMWDDAFRNLYYMLRKNICNIFYVCSPHFVVLFTRTANPTTRHSLCSAHVSQSTRDLRTLLKENDVYFSMPLCHSQAEQMNAEDLVELSEIERQNLGQMRRCTLSSDIDNTPQSLLAFYGNKKVHKLYDFLLNYRSLLKSLSGVDVPVLCAPIPFQNASVSVPEIRCVERKGSVISHKDSKSSLASNIEIKDSFIPVWVISRVCALMRSRVESFEASFITERTSVGLNAALGTPVEDGKRSQENDDVFGVTSTTLCPQMRTGFLRGMKCNSDSCSAFLSPA